MSAMLTGSFSTDQNFSFSGATPRLGKSVVSSRLGSFCRRRYTVRAKARMSSTFFLPSRSANCARVRMNDESTNG